jgi:hypothetical protein
MESVHEKCRTICKPLEAKKNPFYGAFTNEGISTQRIVRAPGGYKDDAMLTDAKRLNVVDEVYADQVRIGYGRMMPRDRSRATPRCRSPRFLIWSSRSTTR